MPSLKTLRHQEVLFSRLFEELTQIRIDEPERAFSVAKRRKRRSRLTADGKLNILAADHPGRRVVNAGHDDLAMADREDFITRIARIASADAVDGILATMDVLEELLLLHDLMQSKGLPPFLDNKLLLVSLNRGGLKGVSWELDDPITGPSPEQCAAWKMDGVKMLWRLCDDDPDSLKTMQYCAEAITASNKARLPFFLEPVPVTRTAGGIALRRDTKSLTEIVGAATALGDSSRYLWLKLPYCAELSRVAQATTLPILLVGGETNDTKEFIKQIKDGMAANHNIRGTMIGRNVLYPVDQDPVNMAAAVHELVHKHVDPEISCDPER